MAKTLLLHAGESGIQSPNPQPSKPENPCYTLTQDGKETILKVFLLRAIGINSVDAWQDADNIAQRYNLTLPARYQNADNIAQRYNLTLPARYQKTKKGGDFDGK